MGYLFFSGAEMDPTALRAALPGARFVARARMDAGGAPVAAAFSAHLDGEVWGILVAVDGVEGAAPTTTDDGRVFDALLGSPEPLSGDAEAVLAAARYWELPPPYVARLRAAVAALGGQATEEDPSDGN